MKETTDRTKKLFILVPTFGILIFCVCYFIATKFYSGGSHSDKFSVGFDWLNNYWCDLIGELAMNGQPNKARPIALFAMSVLSFALSIFWWILPRLFEEKKFFFLIRYIGVTSLVILLFLFTSYHDLIINISGTLGIVALTLTFYRLYKTRHFRLFTYGVFCLFLMLLNYFIYTTGIFISALAIIQKLTFVFF